MTVNFGKPFRVGTLNVRGLGSKGRQLNLRTLIREKDLDVIGIQETKVESEVHTDRMVEPFVDEFYVAVSHSVGLSAGCCLLLSKSLGIVVDNVVSSQIGRFVICDFVYERVEFRVLCMYAPTKPKPRYEFFESLESYFQTEKVLLVLGDFNCVCFPEDRSNVEGTVDRSGKLLGRIAADNLLEDVAMIVEGGKGVLYTHFQGASHARLDRIYVSADLTPICNDYEVHEVSFSDHCLVAVSLGKKSRLKSNFTVPSGK
ncbi:hypothetical protein HPB48_016442 [Haemaphysalis longicornis]|uniref:exodeoxyribonuclease III n=1 Tax=Haemaphysalis longicornis TaxID=44386 RepID=A0A9J6FEH2_HAELO|nr:hypothetical protein HPB48_016442 [Haemaphysalis longicornis]